MSKFLAASMATLMTVAAVPAFAQNSSATASASATTSVSTSLTAEQLTCIGAAVNARETAAISARTTFHASILAALTARQTGLKNAFTIANNADRQVAITTTMKAFTKATMDARKAYKTSLEASFKTFKDSSTQCNLPAGSDRGEKKGMGKLMRGLMKGHMGFGMGHEDGGGDASIDLGL
jgi:phage-related protein